MATKEKRLKSLADDIASRSEKVLTLYCRLQRGDAKVTLKDLSKQLIDRYTKQSQREEEFYKNACEVLGKILEKMEYMEETMCNVLMAIRQNEYLHPWYPKEATSTIEHLNERGIAYKT